MVVRKQKVIISAQILAEQAWVLLIKLNREGLKPSAEHRMLQLHRLQSRAYSRYLRRLKNLSV